MKVIIAVDESPYCKRVLETIAARKWPVDTAFRVLSVVEPITKEELDEEESASWKGVTKQAFNRRKKSRVKFARKASKSSNRNIQIALFTWRFAKETLAMKSLKLP